jgi:inhibitor of KinA
MMQIQNNSFNIYYLSEQAITIAFGDAISESLQQLVSRFNNHIHQHPFPGFRTTVAAYTTLTVFFDPLQVIASALWGNNCFDKVCNYIQAIELDSTQHQDLHNSAITIPVCYGGPFGPDIDEVVQLHHLTTQEIINLHSAAIYTVYMIGFVPGFAYLGGMDNQLATPRKPTPRAAVPAGAVGIAGEQTGIYPLETPGGWQIIGQTPLRMFDAHHTQPALLKAGDRVKFEPITQQEFANYSA